MARPGRVALLSPLHLVSPMRVLYLVAAYSRPLRMPVFEVKQLPIGCRNKLASLFKALQRESGVFTMQNVGGKWKYEVSR